MSLPTTFSQFLRLQFVPHPQSVQLHTVYKEGYWNGIVLGLASLQMCCNPLKKNGEPYLSPVSSKQQQFWNDNSYAIYTSFRLNWFYNDSSHRHSIWVLVNGLFNFFKTAQIFGLILRLVMFQWILVLWEWCAWPFHHWDIKLIYRLTISHREATCKGRDAGHHRKLSLNFENCMQNLPMLRPWNPPVKESTLSFGMPGSCR